MKTEKKCTKCGKTKSIDEFYKNCATRDGKANSCKECDKKRGRKNYKNMTLNIADFPDETLFAEIRKRGYAGELSFTRTIAI